MLEGIYDIIIKTGWVFIPLFITGMAGWYLCFNVLFFYVEQKKMLQESGTIAPDHYRRTILAPWLAKITSIRAFANTSPLLGLLGTVSGMINTFKVISFYGNSNAILMADSISEALLTTQAGLIIAFPLLFTSVILKARLQNLVKLAEYNASPQLKKMAT